MVTVGVPIFNAEAYLLECMYSVIRQSYKDIEIICVDDCTQDNSATIIKQLMKLDSRIKLITHKQNQGLGGARNTIIKEAKGEYILFVDSDDGLAPDAVENLLYAIEDNKADVSMGAVLSFYPDGYQDKESTFHYHKYVDAHIIELNTANTKYELINIWPSAWAKLFRTEVIRQYGLSFPERLLYEDHWFYYSYFKNISRVAYTNKTVYFYRKARVGSITSGATGREEEVFKVIQGIGEILKNFLSDEYYDRAIMRLSFRLLNERQYVLINHRDLWLDYSQKAKKYLTDRFDLKKLQDAVDGFEQETADFYRFIFNPAQGLKITLKAHLMTHRRFRNWIRRLKGKPPLQVEIPSIPVQRVEYINDPIISAISYAEMLRLELYQKIKQQQEKKRLKRLYAKQKMRKEKELQDVLSSASNLCELLK